MSKENVEAFKRALEAGNRRDFDALLEELDPEVEWHPAMERCWEGKRRCIGGGRALARRCKTFLTLSQSCTSRSLRSVTSAIESSQTAGCGGVARKVVSRSSRPGRTCSSSRTARRLGLGPSSIPGKPSKPPGCGRKTLHGRSVSRRATPCNPAPTGN